MGMAAYANGHGTQKEDACYQATCLGTGPGKTAKLDLVSNSKVCLPEGILNTKDKTDIARCGEGTGKGQGFGQRKCKTGWLCSRFVCIR